MASAFDSAFDGFDFSVDHFALFGATPLYRIDALALDKRYRELQARVHPDRFAHADEAARRVSLQWATRVNEAYQTLKSPLRRGQYLLGLAGHVLDGENNAVMATEFLMEQMEWREAVAEARQACDVDALEQLHHRVKQRMREHFVQLELLLDDRHDYVEAADILRRLMFLEKLLAEVDDGLVALET